jgi:hypothetical protein
LRGTALVRTIYPAVPDSRSPIRLFSTFVASSGRHWAYNTPRRSLAFHQPLSPDRLLRMSRWASDSWLERLWAVQTLYNLLKTCLLSDIYNYVFSTIRNKRFANSRTKQTSCKFPLHLHLLPLTIFSLSQPHASTHQRWRSKPACARSLHPKDTRSPAQQTSPAPN